MKRSESHWLTAQSGKNKSRSLNETQITGDSKGLGTMVAVRSVTQWRLLARNLEKVQNMKKLKLSADEEEP